MGKNEIIDLIARTKGLKNYAYSLCNGRDIHNDLFQTFLLELCETDEQLLLEKYHSIQIIGYSKMRLWALNKNRLRDSKYTNTKNELVERYNDKDVTINLIDNDSYNYEVDEKFDKTIDFLETNPKVKKYQVAILFHTINNSTREVAETIGAKQREVIYQNNKLKQLVRQNVR